MKRILIIIGAGAVLVAGLWTVWGQKAQFLAGGILVNLGYRMQDHLEKYDFQHEDATPEEVWGEFLQQNQMASSVRAVFPRSARHPVAVLVACMDARLDTNEIVGDTRRYYYVVRLAGSVLAPKEEEMMELAVANGVKVVVFTTHTDCAAEKASRDAKQAAQYPELTQSLVEREARLNEFMKRPFIAERLASGRLLVKWMDLDTQTERVLPHQPAR